MQVAFERRDDEAEFGEELGGFAFLRRHGVSGETLRAAARIARTSGVPIDAALIRTGLLGEDAFYRALAAEVGLAFAETLPIHTMARYPEGVLTGLVPLQDRERMAVGRAIVPTRFAYAPAGPAVAQLLANRHRLPPGLAITTPTAIRDGLLLARAEAIAVEAADGLPRVAPSDSYRDGVSGHQSLAGFVLGAATGAAFVAAPAESGLGATFLAGAAFLGSTAIRLAAVLEHAPVAPARAPRRIADRDLPVYTILVALHREAAVVPKLLRALAAFDYPAAKLDIKIILESDDFATLAVVRREGLRGNVELIVAPPGEPRTKPRALNVALPLARGEYLAIYDAEDVPDPGQLRLAAEIFAKAAPDVGCLQARLVIDNSHDTWLTRLFAIEYAALFDVINPALVRFDLPMPLGGSSNHFRTRVLKRLGGWDAWNVTEDADLGLRLARHGLRVLDLPSSTSEEAPRTLHAWLRQRTRWMKGFLQVSITHSRHPVAGWRQFGIARLLGAAAVSFGTVASAFGFPLFTALACVEIWSGRLLAAASPIEIAETAIGVTVFAAGLLSLLLPPAVALRRRGWTGLMPLVALMPFYYALVSVAAWRGLFELVLAPDRWNKTEHGLARTSRRDTADAQPRARRSLAAASGGRSRLKEPTKRPSLSIR